ncbi:disulfide isomerase [Sarocladium strictum]
MVSVTSFILATLSATAVTAASGVLNLGSHNFDEVVLESGKATFVEFVAPWCDHCKKLAPVWEELAVGLQSHKNKIQIAKVDVEAEKALGERFGISRFPTFKYFDGTSKSPQVYKAARDLESLTAFVLQKTSIKQQGKLKTHNSSIEMLTEKTFHEKVGGEKNVFVAFTAPWCGHCKKLAPTWEAVAATLSSDNTIIGKVDVESGNNKAMARKLGIGGYPTILWFPAGSNESVKYTGKRTEESLLEFVKEQTSTVDALADAENEKFKKLAEKVKEEL